MENNKKTLSIAALILGISPWITMWIPGLNLLNAPLALAAIIVGILAKKEGKNAMRIVGIVLGSISLAFFILGIILILVAGDALLDLVQ